jgi:hypothetical protein
MKQRSVVNNNDIVAFEVDNTYEPASKQWGGSEVNAKTSNGMNPPEDSQNDNHHFGYEEHGGDLKVEVNATMGSEVVGTRDNVSCSIYTSPLTILVNRKLGTTRIRGFIFNSVINSKTPV